MSDMPPRNDRPEIDAIDGRLAMFISDAPVAIAMFDCNMRFVVWSRHWAERYGAGNRNLRGKTLCDAFPDLPSHLRDAQQRALAGEAVVCETAGEKYSDGLVTCDRWHINPIADGNGHIIGITTFCEVITQQKKLEAQIKDSEMLLRLLIDVLGIGIVEWDLKTGRSGTCETLQNLIGLDDRDLPSDLAGWITALNPHDHQAFHDAWHRANDPESDGLFTAEVEPVVAGGHRHMQLIGRVLFSEAGNQKSPSRFLGILIDTTERFKLQSSLARAQRLETIGRFSGIIAHDFNNLLSVILANLELATMRVSDIATNELLQSAIDAAAIGGDFNRKLLSLSGERETKPPFILLDEHILKTWAMLERMLNDDISLHFIPGAENLCTRIDPAEMDGAILNLVVNARDAQPQGGKIVIATQAIEIRPETSTAFPEGKLGRYMELSVSDCGIGMSSAEIQKAREPFFTSKAPTVGKGLGLSSVDASVSRVDGFMTIESTPGTGTKVSLFLPIVECPPPKAVQQEEMPFGDGQLVLVVEDDAMVREATLKRLEALGYAVIEASDGAEALALLAAGEPVDLVFSDLVMPGELSGYDLLDEVQRHYPKIARLLTSGYASKRRKPQTPSAPLPELLKKPYSMAVLARAVERALKYPPP